MRYRNQATELSRTKDNRLTTREKKNAAVTETAAETNLESKSKKSKDGVDPDEAELLSSLTGAFAPSIREKHRETNIQ